MTKPGMGSLNSITEKIIKCAIEVHKNLGAGLLESIYEKAMCYEFSSHDINFKAQVIIPIMYKGTSLGDHRIDALVENEIIVEYKAVDRMDPVFKAQVLSYLKLANKKLGLLIKFNEPVLKDGLQRLIL